MQMVDGKRLLENNNLYLNVFLFYVINNMYLWDHRHTRRQKGQETFLLATVWEHVMNETQRYELWIEVFLQEDVLFVVS